MGIAFDGKKVSGAAFGGKAIAGIAQNGRIVFRKVPQWEIIDPFQELVGDVYSFDFGGIVSNSDEINNVRLTFDSVGKPDKIGTNPSDFTPILQPYSTDLLNDELVVDIPRSSGWDAGTKHPLIADESEMLALIPEYDQSLYNAATVKAFTSPYVIIDISISRITFGYTVPIARDDGSSFLVPANGAVIAMYSDSDGDHFFDLSLESAIATK